MKQAVRLYWVVTIPMLVVFLMSSLRPFFQKAATERLYEYIEFPFWLSYPISLITIVAIFFLLFSKNYHIRELIYIGLFFQGVFALAAHIIANEWTRWHLSALSIFFTAISVVMFQYMRNLDKKEQEKEQEKEEEEDYPSS